MDKTTESKIDTLEEILLLVNVNSIANTENIPLSQHKSLKSKWLVGNGSNKIGTFESAMASFDIGIKSMVDAFKEIASIFSSKTTTKMIGEDCCLGFDKFALETNTNIIECLSDDHVTEFVEN